MLTAFYQTTSQLCFTLLGLWWLVLQTKYSEWISDHARRRLATTISLYFLLPGAMSLLALLSADNPLLWRIAFTIASILGVVVTAPVWGPQRTVAKEATPLARGSGFGVEIFIAARWFGVVVYLFVLTLSIDPGIARLVGATPLLLTGVGLSLLIVLGVSLAWSYFLEPGAQGSEPRA